ncbi:unnamed protein product [Adineta steineri]|uniref:Uncharacterized protein n=1 Tax=Adineta steineri TaxID=433720 RepID=A0A819WWF4_9BILA|nr:unnamed protein product [Adineta steineri]
MTLEFLVLLLPIVFIGTVVFHESSKSTSIVTNKRVDVEFFVMSKCRDAMLCETLFIPSLLKLSSIINFTLSFIAREPEKNEFECLFGARECTGNKQQLCVQNMYSFSTFLQYLQCQTETYRTIPDNGEQCANETSNNLIKWSDVELCVTSEKSNELFHQSLEQTRLASARKSCTIHLNKESWCIHDGSWKNCTEGHNERSFIKAICSRYNGTDKPIECETFI